MISKTFRRIGIGAFGVAASLAAACGGGSTDPGGGTPAALTVLSSPPASAPAGTTITTPLSVIVNDSKGKAVPSVVVAFKVTAGNGTLSAGAAATDATGKASTTFTLGSSAGTNSVTASVTGITSTATFSITGIPASTCTTPTAIAVGQVVTDVGLTSLCVGGTTSQDYTVIAVGMSATASAKTSFSIVGNSIGGSPGLLSRGNTETLAGLGSIGAMPTRKRDDATETAVMARQMRALTPMMAAARSVYASRHARGGALFSQSPVPATAQVGDLIQMNVDGNTDCPASPATTRNAVVKAVGAKSIILEDSQNPLSDITTNDYQSIANQFDALVDPLDRAAFGDVTDIDGNGRVVILYTKTINAMTPAGQNNSYVGGLTAPRDLFPTTASGGLQACPGSNYAEMFYMLAADTGGAVNGHKYNAAFIRDTITIGTIAHEYQHLINFSRRLYVNNAPFEEVWLNEGLSHEAEELLFFRVSGFAPRSNAGGGNINTNAQINAFNAYFLGDFGRYDTYISATYTSSPYMPDDSLQTRGATQFFLRYAADRIATSDGNIWFKLCNGPATGRANLAAAYGVDDAGLQGMFRDFAVSVWADGALAVDPKYTQPSWDIRSIYPRLNSNPPILFPLVDPTTPSVERVLTDGVAIPVTLNGGGFAVLRASTVAGANATIQLTGAGGGGLPVGTKLTLAVIRTR